MKTNVWKQPYRHLLQQDQILNDVLKQTKCQIHTKENGTMISHWSKGFGFNS
jgi:hypothetical protein